MQLKRDDTLILFGRSPFINQIKDYIPVLIKNWHTMGINYFCNTFPDVEYVLFYDDIVPDVANSTIITDKQNWENESRKSYQLCRSYPKIELYKIQEKRNRFSEEEGVLSYCAHSPSIALDWAYQKGFNNIILAGIDLVRGTKHFDSEDYIFGEYAIQAARSHLENIATRYLNIFQLNPDSDLRLKKIEINDLLGVK